MVDDVEMNFADLPQPTDTEAALAAVVALRRSADRLELAAVQSAIDKSWTWAAIAEALGVTKQAVHKRYARRVTQSPQSRQREEER
ncbi:MAG: hypothetical protein Q8M65_07305 [Rhodoglobus sp.]|nr:hypothetical protein [Rhodoglobus sp.]